MCIFVKSNTAFSSVVCFMSLLSLILLVGIGRRLKRDSIPFLCSALWVSCVSLSLISVTAVRFPLSSKSLDFHCIHGPQFSAYLSELSGKLHFTSFYFQKMVCHGEHTYLFAQAIMSILAQEEQGGSAMRRIAQEVQRFAHEK